ncbi:MAG: CcdB family protein [Pacificimonas sp.]
MSKYDVVRSRAGTLLVICQAEHIDVLRTRFVIPLVDIDRLPTPLDRLNPQFEINGKLLSFAPQLAATVHEAECSDYVGTLAAHDYEITKAIDTLLTEV